MIHLHEVRTGAGTMSLRSRNHWLTTSRFALSVALTAAMMSAGCGQASDRADVTTRISPAAPTSEPTRGAAPAPTDFAGRAAALELTLSRFMGSEPSTKEASRSRLADELVLLIRLALDNQRLQADVEKELNGPEVGYFLARLEALREETERRNALQELPAEHWSRIFEGDQVDIGDDRFELEPFRAEPFRPLQSELGEVPTAMIGVGGSERRILMMNLALLVLRKHDPALALRLQRNLVPEVANVLFVERMNYLGYSVYPVLAREISAKEKVPKVDDPARACADYLERFIAEIVPAVRAKKAIEMEMEVRGKAFEELHRRVLGRTMEQMLQDREDSTDTDPLLAWRDLVREFHPERSADVSAMIQFMTTPVIDSNQSAARSRLTDIYAAQKQFHDADSDGNGNADYWAADVSGLRRFLVDGKPIELIDESLVRLDARPLTGDPALAKMPDVDDAAKKPGYLLVAVKLDVDGRPLAAKAGDSVTAGRSARKFAVCAYPRTYGRTGRQTYLIMEDGRIRYKDTEGQPVERLPANFDDDDWTTTEEPVEAAMSGSAPKKTIEDLDAYVDKHGRTTAGLIRLLANPNLEVAEVAARRFRYQLIVDDVEARSALRQGLPQLISSLRRPSWQLRESIADAMTDLGGEAAEAVPALTESLIEDEAIKNSWDREGRISAGAAIAVALGTIGVKNDAAAKNLLAVVKGNDPAARVAAAWALSVIHAAQLDIPLRSVLVEDLKPLLSDPTANDVDEVYRAAHIAVWFEPPAAELADCLLECLPHAAREWKHHKAAFPMAYAAAKVGDREKLHRRMIELCNESLPDKNSPGGIAPELHFVARRIGSLYTLDPEMIRTLVGAVKGVAPHGERKAVELFGRAFQESGQAGVLALADLVNESPRLFIEGVGVPSREPYRRIALGVLLKRTGDIPNAEQLAHGLLSDYYLGDLAVDLLSATKHDDTLERLRGQLPLRRSDTRSQLKYAKLYTSEAIVRLGGKFDEVRNVYDELLQDTLFTIDALHSLRRLGKAADSMIPLLGAAAIGEGLAKQDDKESGFYVQAVAARALLSVGGDHRVPLSTASRLLSRQSTLNSTTREEAVKLLGEIGPAAAGEIPTLVEILRSPDLPTDGFVETAILALTAMGSAAREPLQMLVRDYRSERQLIYLCAAEALEALEQAQTKPASVPNSPESSP